MCVNLATVKKCAENNRKQNGNHSALTNLRRLPMTTPKRSQKCYGLRPVLIATVYDHADTNTQLQTSLRDQAVDNNKLHTEPRAARLLETVIFAAAR